MQQNEKGFTLIELLIVVAILCVLAAIAIPTYQGSLMRARAAVDLSSVRSAKSVAVAEYMLSGDMTEAKTYYFDSDITPHESPDGIAGYGKSTVELPNAAYHLPDDFAAGVPKDGFVSVTVSADGTMTASWLGGSASSGEAGGEGGTGDGGTEDAGRFEKVFTTSISWDDIKAAPYGSYSLPWGTVFSDGDRQFLAFGTQYSYSTFGHSTVDDFVSAYSNSILELTSSITPLTADSINNTEIAGGTVWLYNGVYYVARETYTVSNQQIPQGNANWAKISGQD